MCDEKNAIFKIKRNSSVSHYFHYKVKFKQALTVLPKYQFVYMQLYDSQISNS